MLSMGEGLRSARQVLAQALAQAVQCKGGKREETGSPAAAQAL